MIPVVYRDGWPAGKLFLFGRWSRRQDDPPHLFQFSQPLMTLTTTEPEKIFPKGSSLLVNRLPLGGADDHATIHKGLVP